MARQELDPITLQVISGALDTVAEEMGTLRSSGRCPAASLRP